MIAVVLAAGKGTRMRSDLPKVVHRLAGEPLVRYPVRAAVQAGATGVVVVVGHGAELVEQALDGVAPAASLAYVLQAQQRGTGHAVLCALPSVPDTDDAVLILCGDVPLLRSESVARLVDGWRASSAGLAVAIFKPDDRTGYGRIVRDAQGRIVAIREERDADEAERAIAECNSGIYCVTAGHLHRELPGLGADNDQGEIYLTDLVAVLAGQGEVIGVEIDPIEAAGVNTVEQLAELEKHL